MKTTKQNHRRGSALRAITLSALLFIAMSATAETAHSSNPMCCNNALCINLLVVQPLKTDTLIIRDFAPIPSGEPLFIVNKREVDPEIVFALNPNFIEQIDILKDTSATALYGTRGINGVVVITLKTKEQVNEEKATKQIEQMLKLKGADKQKVRYYVDGKEVTAKTACQTAIEQMDVKTGTDGATEVYIKSIVFIRGEHE